jgi:hypothetical protein
MTRKLATAAVMACGLFMAACDSSPIAPDAARPQFDGRGRPTTSTTMTTSTTTKAPGDTTTYTTTTSGGEIGDPCDPATYSGPYRCIPDETVLGGYVIAY